MFSIGPPVVAAAVGVCLATASDDSGRLIATLQQQHANLVLVVMSSQQLVVLGEAVVEELPTSESIVTTPVSVMWSPDGQLVLIWRADTTRITVWRIHELLVRGVACVCVRV